MPRRHLAHYLQVGSAAANPAGKLQRAARMRELGRLVRLGGGAERERV